MGLGSSNNKSQDWSDQEVLAFLYTINKRGLEKDWTQFNLNYYFLFNNKTEIIIKFPSGLRMGLLLSVLMKFLQNY